jgi:hypothetical protein
MTVEVDGQKTMGGCGCTNSKTGKDKIRYATQSQADVACKESRKKWTDGDTLNSYRCPDGECWHVGNSSWDNPDDFDEMAGEVLAPIGTNSALDTGAFRTLTQLEERNRIARETIKRYANRHAKMDIAIGAAGVFGLAIPALIVAIGDQSKVIYKPLARELAVIYNSDVDEKTKQIVSDNLLLTGAADIANEFGSEFIVSIASELITEAGVGAMFGLIPLVGGVIGAALDYIIATVMTWRVGTMVAIYYQNGGKWVESRNHTLELAKGMTGGFKFGMKDLVARFTGDNRQDINVDLNSIPTRFLKYSGAKYGAFDHSLTCY